MNELVWEGLLEILREGQPSLKASAHLWRRDDYFGADWGGQLELPVVFRRLLPAEEYQVRLPSGVEARVRVAAGPSTTTMTFPTLTGIGHPPFGSMAPAEAEEPVSRSGEATMTLRADGDEAVTAAAEPRQTRERGTRAAEAPRSPRAAAPAATPAPVQATAKAPTPVAAPSQAADESRSSGRPGRAAPARGRVPRASGYSAQRVSSGGFDLEESVEQTEALARAFLAAIEARQVIRPLEHAGFEGRAIAAARQDVELIAATLESALRARGGATDWSDELRNHLAVASWFASLAAPDEQPEVAAAGQAVQALLGTIEALLAITADGTGAVAPSSRAA